VQWPDYGPDDPGFESRQGQDILLFCRSVDRLWAPPSRLFNAYRFFFLRVKRPGRDANQSSPSSAVVKNEWSCTSVPPVCLHGVDKFLFYRSWFIAVNVWPCIVFV
jgi:hypothetical protein